MDVVRVEEIENVRVPDAFMPVVGYRRFGIPWPSPPRQQDDYLAQRGQRWVPRAPTAAECRRPAASACGEVVPAQSCACGLYAWLDVEEAFRYSHIATQRGWVLASVIGWGRVLFDEDFWRAEMARVVAFADPSDTHSDKPEIERKRSASWLERVAANYGVPILPLEELRGYTLMYGEEYVEDG